MSRYIVGLLLLTMLVIAGCSVSVESYRADMNQVRLMIDESAAKAYDACQENQSLAVASTVIKQKMGKPFMSPEAVNKLTKQDLEQRWMNVEVKYGSLGNPPAGCEEEYKSLKKMHDAYGKLHQLAISPAGPVEQYQQTTDVLYSMIGEESAELGGTFATN